MIDSINHIYSMKNYWWLAHFSKKESTPTPTPALPGIDEDMRVILQGGILSRKKKPGASSSFFHSLLWQNIHVS